MCVYKTDDGICKKYSTDDVTSYCIDGPCTEEVLTNADKIRSMTDKELSEIFTNYAYEAHGKWYGPDKESYWSESQYALKEWLGWLRQPEKEE